MALEILAATYVAVLSAELFGDKTMYTLGSLTAAYRVLPLLLGASVAFMGKAAVAVVFGRFLAMLPPRLLAATSAITFFGMAITLYCKKLRAPEESSPRPARAFLAGFIAIFFSEWADIGQLTTGLVTARVGHPVLVWAGSVLAMITKGAVATTAGTGIRRWVDLVWFKRISIITCVVLGVLSAFGVH